VLAIYPSGQASATRQFASCKGGVGGWDIKTTGANALLTWLMYDTTPNGVSYTNTVLGAADLDKIQLYVGVWDGPALTQRAYFKRAAVGSGIGRSGYTPSPTDTLTIGLVASEPATPGGSTQVYGFAYGLGVPTLAEVQALYDSVQANERMMGIPGKTDHLHRFDGLPATVADAQGSAALTRNGSPTLSEMFARAWAW
jgi:hypothetical protein